MTTVHGGNGCKHSSLTVFHRLNDVVAQSSMTMKGTAGLVGTFRSFGVAHGKRQQSGKSWTQLSVQSIERPRTKKERSQRYGCLLPDATDC